MIGKRVLMKRKNAKWYLEHPEVYHVHVAGNMDEDYEPETLLHLVCALGEPVYGIVIDEGNDCWMVSWRVGSLSATYLIDRTSFTVVEHI